MTVAEKEKMRALEVELAEVKAHYRLCEAELALAKAAYAGAVAKLGADDLTDITNAADEAWLRATSDYHQDAMAGRERAREEAA